MNKINYYFLITVIFCTLKTNYIYSFENAALLPKGVRNFKLRTVNLGFRSKTNSNQKSIALAQPFEKNIRFENIAANLKELELKQLNAFLGLNNFNLTDSLGQFQADMTGNVSVIAPIIAYGLNSNITLAIAIPFYRANMDIELGFKASETTKRFLNVLNDPNNNQKSKAQTVARKLNNAINKLQEKFTSNGFAKVDNWQDSGIGDITMALKTQGYNSDMIKVALTPGLVAPTGRVDDPDIINDIPFGDGQWDLFTTVAIDEKLSEELTLNQYAKYTIQLADSKKIRAITKTEKIAVVKQNVGFKLGDKLELGTSVNWLNHYGISGGLGYNYYKKFSDSYYDINKESAAALASNTIQESHNTEIAVGFSTIPFFKRGAFALPMNVSLSLLHPLASRNMPTANRLQLDVNVFF